MNSTGLQIESVLNSQSTTRKMEQLK